MLRFNSFNPLAQLIYFVSVLLVSMFTLDLKINLGHKIRCPFYRYPGRPLVVHKKGPHRFYQLNDPLCVYLHMFYLLQPHNPGHSS